LRTIQTRALQAGDSIFWGTAAVLEAYTIGTVADIWGDVPYSEAANPTIPTPKPDPQQAVFAAIQAKLDSAIQFLAATGPRNKGRATTIWSTPATQRCGPRSHTPSKPVTSCTWPGRTRRRTRRRWRRRRPGSSRVGT